MSFRHYCPHPALRHFVRRIVVSRFSFETASEAIIPFPPQPEHCLYFYPAKKLSSRLSGEEEFRPMPESTLVGPHATRVDLRMPQKGAVVILVGFQPGGMHRLLRLPMHEMRDAPLQAADMFGAEIGRVSEQLAETDDVDEMARIVQHFLLCKADDLKDQLPLDAALQHVLGQSWLWRVDALAAASCVSTRQLERQFRERIGLPPKEYLRLLRFSRAWLQHERRPETSWLSVAHACGYADQMHMIRDFRVFAGVTPGVLQRHLMESPVTIQGETFI